MSVAAAVAYLFYRVMRHLINVVADSMPGRECVVMGISGNTWRRLFAGTHALIPIVAGLWMSFSAASLSCKQLQQSAAPFVGMCIAALQYSDKRPIIQ